MPLIGLAIAWRRCLLAGSWSGARRAGWHRWRSARRLLASLAAQLRAACGSAISSCSPLAPALAYLAVAAGQGARDYAAERRRRRDITRAFSHYLSPDLVERLADDPRSCKLGGERRTLTMLFCDVRGFTTIAERMKDDPEQLTALINRLLTRCPTWCWTMAAPSTNISATAIMAFWNAPLDDPDHAAHAVERGARHAGGDRRAERRAASERRSVGGRGRCAEDRRRHQHRRLHRRQYGLEPPLRLFRARRRGQSRLPARRRTEELRVPHPARRGDRTAGAPAYTVVELDRIIVKGKSQETRIFTVVPETDAETLGYHQLLLDDHYAGRLLPGDERFAALARKLPTLAGYYEKLRKRTSG